MTAAAPVRAPGTCKYGDGKPGRLYLGGLMCEEHAPPTQPTPPPGTTATELRDRAATRRQEDLMGHYGEQHDAVKALLERAHRLALDEADRLMEATRDRSWPADVRQMQRALGWRVDDILNPEAPDVAQAVADLRAERAAHNDTAACAVRACLAGRKVAPHKFGVLSFHPVAWTAAAVAARHALPTEVYLAVTAPWRVTIGHAHPDDGSRGTPIAQQSEAVAR